MAKQRFYFDLPTENDDDAFNEAAELGCELSRQDSEINRIVFLASHKDATGWLQRVYEEKYGPKIICQLYNGFELKPGFPKFQILLGKDYSEKTAKHDVVIVMGTASNFLPEIEGLSSVRAIIAIPSVMNNKLVLDWLETYKPDKIRGQNTLWEVPPRE